MKKIEMKAARKLTKQRRKLYVCSTLNQLKLVNHLHVFIPTLNETIAEIKKNKHWEQRHTRQLKIKGTSQLFAFLTDKEKRRSYQLIRISFVLF